MKAKLGFHFFSFATDHFAFHFSDFFSRFVPQLRFKEKATTTTVGDAGGKLTNSATRDILQVAEMVSCGRIFSPSDHRSATKLGDS